jgi:hypothetical protein
MIVVGNVPVISWREQVTFQWDDERWNRQTLIENKNKPTVETTDTHRKQKQTNGGNDRHS